MLARSLAARNVPPHDAEATTPEAAYPISLLLSSDAARSLETKRLLDASEDNAKLDTLREKNIVRQPVVHG